MNDIGAVQDALSNLRRRMMEFDKWCFHRSRLAKRFALRVKAFSIVMHDRELTGLRLHLTPHSSKVKP